MTSRCIAHDRRGHGRSSQPWNGNDKDTYADDLAALVEALDLKDAKQRGLVARHVEDGPPVRVQYSLTRKGRAFGHVAQAIERWGRELISDR